MTFRILITARTVWQALDWLSTTTGRSDYTLNVTNRIITLGRIEVQVLMPEDYEERDRWMRFLGCEFDLLIYLHNCPMHVREFLLTRWRP